MGWVHILVALIAAVPAVIAAVASWKAASRTRQVGNGWTVDVTTELNDQTQQLGRIEGLLEAHVKDERAHLPKAE